MWALYKKYFSIHIKSIMQYKMSFFFTAMGLFFVSFNAFLGIFFLFQRFHTVKGFTYNEVLLCFSIMLMEFSLAEVFARGFDTFPSMISNGQFDRIMVRPQNAILQVLGSRIDFTRIARLLQAVVMFVYGIAASDVQWTFLRVMTVIFMLLGGSLLFFGIFLIYAAISFFTLEGLEFMNVLTDGASTHGRYPLSVYGKRVLQFCTFVIPYALVQYYPLLYVLGKADNPFYVVLPLLAALFLLPCWGIWRLGVRHYKSTGS